MELFSSTTRFALACNVSTKVIEPIQVLATSGSRLRATTLTVGCHLQSRCAILRFTRLTDQEMLERLLQVIEMENVRALRMRNSRNRAANFLVGVSQVKYTDKGLEALLFTADGDMRYVLNNLQATVSGFGFVDDTNVFKVGASLF